MIDSEVSRILSESHERVRQLLGTRRGHLERLAAELLVKETISGEQLEELLGEKACGGETP